MRVETVTETFVGSVPWRDQYDTDANSYEDTMCDVKYDAGVHKYMHTLNRTDNNLNNAASTSFSALYADSII